MDNETQPKYRSVNRILGDQPRIGPIPADQAVPWAAISTIIYVICKGVFGISLLWTILLIGWGIATWWTLTGGKSWKYLSKFVPAPKSLTRGYAFYYSLLDTEQSEDEPYSRRSKKQSQKTRVRHANKARTAKR